MHIEDGQGQIINIYSSSRLSYSVSDTDFWTELIINQGRDYDYMCVLQAAIPTSYYPVASPYNTFTFKEDAVSHTITVPAGSYTVDALMTVLDTLLEAASTTSAQFSITYPDSFSAADTGKITYTITSGSASVYSFIFNSSTGINVQMGFDASSTNTFVLGALTSSNVINMKTNKIVYITCDQISDSCGHILQEIPNQAWSNMSVIGFQTTSIEGWSKKIASWPTTLFHFTLRDEANQLIDLNGQPWAFSLLFYKKSTNNKKFQDNILKKLDTVQSLLDNIDNTLYVRSTRKDAKNIQQEEPQPPGEPEATINP